ncbi:MAG: multiheme c-type cytochrome [Chloroflexota bacterium]|nr:multiheme c-type cytochrome [Chloroflexota bacterium]
MSSKRGLLFSLVFFIPLLALAGLGYVYADPPLPATDDPLVRMPGTQPGQAMVESPANCAICHGDYDPDVEPWSNWRGSMMSQAARDPLFFAAMTVAGQDSNFAIGSPNAMDICLRCHFPMGWIEGRSEPPNASAMTMFDFDGVQCDICHEMVDPFFEDTYLGVREGDDWQNYWDEAANSGPGSGTQAQVAADITRSDDALVLDAIEFFNGNPYFGPDDRPIPSQYDENGGGQFFISPNHERRGPFADATGAPHLWRYSRYHKSKYFCSSCHDVSNPVLQNLDFAGTAPGDGTTVLPTEQLPAYAYFPVERTFSEFMLSDYGQQGGAPGIGPFASDVFSTSQPSNNIATCQDCHMRDVPGRGAHNLPAPLRTGNPATSESSEHPYSAVPRHDLTGGNLWVLDLLASSVPGSANYDPVNEDLLHQGAMTLTLDFSQGLPLDPEALLLAADRTRQALQDAASFDEISVNRAARMLAFRIQNQTGHKLISGYPEGRRMFVNIMIFDGSNQLIQEINPFDTTAGTLKGLPNSPNSPPLASDEIYMDRLVYEMHTKSTLTGEEQTFHFALSDQRHKDNRIPPRGFNIDEAPARFAEPVWQGHPAPSYFTSAEYEGGYDELWLTLPAAAETAEISLFYQTTSREYVEFLRDEIRGTGNLTLPDPDPNTPENEAYIIQSDPFYERLKAWGDTIWQLWQHNKDVPGAAPYLMTQTTVSVGAGCHFADVEPNADHSMPLACDDDVDVADIQRVAACWNEPISASCPTNLDLDGSGIIDVNDTSIAAEAWGWPYD